MKKGKSLDDIYQFQIKQEQIGKDKDQQKKF